MDAYDNLINEVYIRDQITLRRESPASVADKICRGAGIKDVSRKEDVLRRVNLLCAEKGFQFVPVNQMDLKQLIRARQLGTVSLDAAFVADALVGLLDACVGEKEDTGAVDRSTTDLKTARATLADIGKLKQVDAFKTSQDVVLTMKGELDSMTVEEKEELLKKALATQISAGFNV